MSSSFPVPGLKGPPSSLEVLRDIANRAEPEEQDLCQGLLARLECVHDRVAEPETPDKRQEQYARILVRIVKRLRKGRPLLVRLAESSSTADIIKDIHRTLDEGFMDLGLADRADMNEWLPAWERACEKQSQSLQEQVTATSERVLRGRTKDEVQLKDAMMALRAPTDLSEELQQFKLETFERMSRRWKSEDLSIFDWFIYEKDIELDEEFEVHKGTFGQVRRGFWYHNGKRQAVVVKKVFDDIAGYTHDMFLKQLHFWWGLEPHPSILKLYGGCHQSKEPFFVCEAARYQDIITFLRDDKRKKMIWRLFREAAEGLQFLHDNKIIHGGLKGNNILVGEGNKAKLSDFDFSVVRSLSMSSSKYAAKDSVRWKPKEVLERTGSELPMNESDVYSLGMCMIEAITGSPPFDEELDEEEVDLMIRGGEEHPRPDGVSNQAWALISHMCAPQHENRPTLRTVIDQLRELEAASAA